MWWLFIGWHLLSVAFQSFEIWLIKQTVLIMVCSMALCSDEEDEVIGAGEEQ